MMLRITPAVRLSLGLVILTLSILLLAQVLGLTPNVEQRQLRARQELAETLALQTMLAIRRNDQTLLQAMLDNTVARNPAATSAAIRQIGGALIAQTPKHSEFWQGRQSEKSTPTHIYVPITMNGVKRGALEVTFRPLAASEGNFGGISSFALLILFVCISAFVGFWLFIKRALHHLDPSAVVPARVRNALNILAEGVLILDKREHIVLANDTLINRLNTNEKRLIGRKASSLGWHMDSDQPTDLPWLKAMSTGKKQVGVRVTLGQKMGKEIIFRVNAVPIMDGKGASQGTITSFDDVSELEEKNRQLAYLASRDPMTDCYNRRALREQLDVEFQNACVGIELSCIMADIDNFKLINDNYGHSLGDEVIKMVAATIKNIVRESDLVSRFGGEEFCIILPGTDIGQAQVIAERCRKQIAAQNCDGVSVTSSFGIASVAFGAENPNNLIQQADEALYLSKQNGRNRVSLWHSSMTNAIQAK